MGPAADARPKNRVLQVLLVAVSAALGWILLPFYGAILWAAVIALLFEPAFGWLMARLGHRRTPAALLTLVIAAVIAIVPFVVVSTALAHEALQVLERVQSGEWNPALYFRRVFDALPESLLAVLDRFGMGRFDTLQARLSSAATQAAQFLGTRAVGLGQNALEWIVGLFITLYVSFFLIRDGEALVQGLRDAVPLPPAHQQELVDKFATVIRATVKGSLLVATVQGALGGLAFWGLGVGVPLLWAALMAFLALLPAVGAALVWLPVALYFFVTGAIWQGVVLTVFGVLVIGLVDNLLRPMLVGRDTRMPDALVMVSTLGGLAVFGVNGLVLGPAIAAMFLAVWHIHGRAVDQSASTKSM